MSLSNWYYTYQRDFILDFVVTNFNYEVLAFKPKAPEVDPGLFVRPFTLDTWKGLFGVLAVILSMTVAPHYFISFFKSSVAFMIASTFSWSWS